MTQEGRYFSSIMRKEQFVFSFEDEGLIYKHCVHTIQGLNTACAKAVMHKDLTGECAHY